MSKDGIVAKMEAIDGDEESVEFECPRCKLVAWVMVDE
jgi:predicted RNA-binding Zn-ribbon protein involved in translation (DUF1610 family)